MLVPGRLLQARYEIVGPIARGGMGAVYHGHDQRLGQDVAIKQINPRDATMAAAFEQEARLLAALRHPALPTVIDHFVEGSSHFLVMEFVPGDDLATVALRQPEPLAVEVVLRWADQLLDALTYLHRQNPPVIHRDIKPHNLKLNAQGQVMLLDFGLAKSASGGDQAARSLAGYTLHYAAPEQLRGEPSDARTDLYALAATLYDLLAARKPPDALQRLAAATSGLADPLTALDARNPHVPPAVAAVVARALALAPTARFADAAMMRAALHAATGDATKVVEQTATHTPAALYHNLPAQLTSFVAREAEVTAVQRLLQRDDVRLITLTGPGGIGKTRLALAIARQNLATFAAGVFMVELAAISDHTLVLPTIAQTLGVREAANTTVHESLHGYLHDKELLLLLDNFEQVIAAAPVVGELLLHAPRLKILVTSREALHVRGEHEFPLPPLALPNPRQLPDLDMLGDYAAVRLFVQRAQAVKPDFALHLGNAAAVAELCKRLDGLPLALELAAAAVKFLSVPTILARLGERLALPTATLRDLPDRQRTLAASIRWSYDLLTAHEQTLFRRLAIFAGTFTLDAVEALFNASELAEIAVFDMLVSLIGKSLVKPQEDGPVQDGLLQDVNEEPRFVLLETIREFGWQQLDTSGELARVAAAHAAYYDQFVQAAEQQIWGAAMATAVRRLDAEIENVRASLSYYLAAADGAEAALRVAGMLWRYWEIRGYFQEGRDWLERTLARRAEVPPVKCWLPLHGAGNLACDQGDYAISNMHYLDALALLQTLLPTLEEPDEVLRIRYAIANTLSNLGHTAMQLCQYEEAIARSEAAITILRELLTQPTKQRLDVRVGLAIPITNLALIQIYQGDYARAEAYGTEGLALYRALGDIRGLGWNLHTLGTIARNRGEVEQAAKLYQEAQALFEQLANQADMMPLLYDLGELARLQGDDARAEAAYQKSLALAQASGNKKEIANVLDRLGALARRRGQYATAAALANDSVALHRAIGNQLGLSEALYHRGLNALAQLDRCAAAADLGESLEIKARLGERKGIVALLKAAAALQMEVANGAQQAVQLVAVAETLRRTIGVALHPADRDQDAPMMSHLRRVVGDADFGVAWEAGEKMTPDAAISVAQRITKGEK